MAGEPLRINVQGNLLRDLYQRATLLLLPMSASGANTAVVEALSTGLPVVTTDVGGIRDYGGGTIYPVVTDNDDDGMVDLVRQYLTDTALRRQIGTNVRAFATATLSWPLVAQRHIETYRDLVGLK